MDGSTRLPFAREELELSIVDRFESVARRCAQRPAVVEAAGVTTFAELDRAASRFGRALAAQTPETATATATDRPVALLAQAGAPLFAAMLGTLKAGRFYVPLDPRLPAARLERIGRELDTDLVVAGRPALETARALSGARILPLDEMLAGEEESAPSVSSRSGPAGDALAYVLFTSGSTGAPKGVMQSHRNVLHNVRKLADGLGLRPDDRLALLASVSVGASVSDIYGALLNGAAVCPHSLADDGLRRLPAFLERERITVLHCVPSVFRRLASALDGEEDVSAVRLVKLGGEAVFASDLDLFRSRFSGRAVFHVGYGATEMNVIRQWFADGRTPWPGGTPLGYAVDETEIELFDESGRPTPDFGEITIVARTLAVGYWNDAAASTAAFSDVPGRPGFRRYRTGDLGRLLPDGCLLHAGRRDGRLKVRGHRVEAGEVEGALLSIAGVREAAVGVRESAAGSRLVAWIVRREDDPPGIASLRASLAAGLAAWMVPSAFVFLQTLPRTASGKVDRAALPSPSDARPPVGTRDREPHGEVEAAAVAAFRDVLGLERVGADDDFFELGGDSLCAVEALVALSRSLGIELSEADFVERPTPAGIAALAARHGPPRDPRACVLLQSGDRRPVFIVPGGAGDGPDLFAARRIARATGGSFPFYVFRSGPPPHPPAEELAARFLAQMRAVAPAGPYALVGDCVGGIVAFAMARALRAAGGDTTLLALLDAPFPTPEKRRRAFLLRHTPGLVRFFERLAYLRGRLAHHRRVLRSLRRGRLDYALRFARVGLSGGAAPGSPARREFLERRSSYVASALSWTPTPLEGRVLIVESEASAQRGFSAAWRRLVPRLEIVRVPGDHVGFVLDHASEIGETLRRALETPG